MAEQPEIEPTGARVTLQISVAPADVRHARAILPHQLRRWGDQVDEVLFTLDLGERRDCHTSQHAAIKKLLNTLVGRHPGARVVHVNYETSSRERVRRWLSLSRDIPATDCFGKAVYPYFFGIWAARHRYVLHLDSDMMFGGGSDTWIEEAKRVLAHPAVFTCSPLPGPPTQQPWPRHVAIRHAGSRGRRARSRNGARFSAAGLEGSAFAFARVSTRNFMLDRSMLEGGHGGVLLSRPSPRVLLGALSKRALARGHPLCAPAELSLTRTMAQRGLLRVDFLGAQPGMWSLHPPQRSDEFYRALPDVIRRIEADDIPPRQVGDYDLIASDWTIKS